METIINILQKENKEKIDIMKIINQGDKTLLENERVISYSRSDWGKNCSISNQYIQRQILSKKLSPYGYSVFTTDDKDFPKNIDTKNNSPGFDILIQSKDGENFRVQSKLRQVNGKTPFSKQINFETTRRHSEKNIKRCHTGHVCYNIDEFDFVMISLVYDRDDRVNMIKDCNKWSYSFVPKSELIDYDRNCMVSKIEGTILKKYHFL
jgi:hypothetical protein